MLSNIHRFRTWKKAGSFRHRMECLNPDQDEKYRSRRLHRQKGAGILQERGMTRLNTISQRVLVTSWCAMGRGAFVLNLKFLCCLLSCREAEMIPLKTSQILSIPPTLWFSTFLYNQDIRWSLLTLIPLAAQRNQNSHPLSAANGPATANL